VEVRGGLVASRVPTDRRPILSTKRTAVAEKTYVAIRVMNMIDAVDTERSIIETSTRYDYRKITRHLALKPEAVGLDLFRINSMTLSGCLFCSERFRNQALARGARLGLVPEANAAEAFAAANPLGE
jgi:hypothetical protein